MSTSMSCGWGEAERPLVDIVDSLSDGWFLSLRSVVTHRDEPHTRVTCRVGFFGLILLRVANQLRRQLLL